MWFTEARNFVTKTNVLRNDRMTDTDKTVHPSPTERGYKIIQQWVVVITHDSV